MSPIRLLPPVLALSVAGAVAHADSITFQVLSGIASANDMSPDGRFVVGGLNTGGFYIMDTVLGTVTELPSGASEAKAISDDGRTVLGSMPQEFAPGQWAEVAALWTEASGQWTSLGFLPNAGFCPSRSNGYELSADGTVAVGLSWVGCSGRGFRWTAATGMVELQNLANGSNRASVVSADGNLIGGFAQGQFTRTPTLWGPSGAGQLLDPPAGAARGEVWAMNQTGTVVLAEWDGKATKITNGGTVRTTIGNGTLLPGWTGHPTGIAGNGTVIGFDSLAGNRRAWIQVGGTGPLVELREFCVANGANVPVDMLLEVPRAISLDGRTIVGHGFSGAWMVRLPGLPACTGDVAPAGGDGKVDGADLGALLAAWGTAAGDLDGDGSTNGADLGMLLAAWGPCPGATGACCVAGDCSQMTAAQCAQAGGVYLGTGVPCLSGSCTNNDACADAIDVTGNINGQNVFGDNTLATPGAYGGSGDPDLPEGSPSCQWYGMPSAAHSSVWYRVTAPANGKLNLELCDTLAVPFQDSTLAVFTGTCGALVEYACDEDGCTNEGFNSRLELTDLTPGQTYYICVMNAGAWLGSVPGPFTLRITSPGGGPGGGAGGGL
jgi:hypothetical protein